MTNEIQTIEQAPADAPLSVAEMQTQVQLIQQVLANVMISGTHYGVIPGTGDKPSLLKPGAEKIAATFRLSVDPQIEDLSTHDTARYRVTVRLISPTGHFVGAGIGEASGAEKKYRWRAAVCVGEFDDTPVDRRRVSWKKGWNNQPASKINQVMTDAADTANTVLKMAKKRALVDAVLTATAASDIFTQDIEDTPPEILANSRAQNKAPAGVAKQNKAPSADGQTLIDSLTEVAAGGWDKLLEAWGKLEAAQRESVGNAFGAIKAIAMKADK
jgi:hypothetical protein